MAESYLKRVINQQWTQGQAEMQAKYRLVFLKSSYGLDVLEDLFREMSFFSTLDPTSPGQIALHNACKVILGKLGIISDGNTRAMLQALANIPPNEEGGTEG